MKKTYTIAISPGDGAGHDIIGVVQKTLEALAQCRVRFDLEQGRDRLRRLVGVLNHGPHHGETFVCREGLVGKDQRIERAVVAHYPVQQAGKSATARAIRFGNSWPPCLHGCRIAQKTRSRYSGICIPM